MSTVASKQKKSKGLILFIFLILLGLGAGLYYVDLKKKEANKANELANEQAKLDAKKISQEEFDKKAKAFEEIIRTTPKYLAMLEGYIKDPSHNEYGWTIEKSIETHGRYEVIAEGYSVK